MLAGTYNFSMNQGSTLTKTFEVSGLDLGVYTEARMQIRSKPNSDTIIWDSADSGSISIVDDTVILEIPADITELFDFYTAGYDIELVQSDELIDKLLTGEITLVKEYTKPVEESV